MYYIFIENNEINGCGQAQLLGENVINYEVDEALYNTYSENKELYIWDGEKVIEDVDYEEKQIKKEKERIQELSMSRSDFFDGTIKAWGVDKEDLTPIIEQTLELLSLDYITKKVALNNFNNAKDYYRKHTLFTLLSNRTLKLNDTMQVFVTDEQWDKFFDETDKRNKEAYKELPTPELTPVAEPEVTEEPMDITSEN